MIADSKSNLDAARLLTLSCAAAIDEHGPNKARDKIASIKVSVPELAHGVIDNAVQVSTRYRYRYTYRLDPLQCTPLSVHHSPYRTDHGE